MRLGLHILCLPLTDMEDQHNQHNQSFVEHRDVLHVIEIDHMQLCRSSICEALNIPHIRRFQLLTTSGVNRCPGTTGAAHYLEHTRRGDVVSMQQLAPVVDAKS